MPRPTIKITLKCSKCNNYFCVLKWEFTQKRRRCTKKYYCSQKCKTSTQVGETSPTWKGGRRQYPSLNGYVMLRIGPNKRMLEHRYVIEKHLGRKLKSTEVVHHINENPSDNRIENLVVCKSAGEHSAKYHPKKRSTRGTYLNEKL